MRAALLVGAGQSDRRRRSRGTGWRRRRADPRRRSGPVRFGRERLQWQVADTVDTVDHGPRGVREGRRRGRTGSAKSASVRQWSVEPNLACFRCGPCQRGLTSACENRLSVGMNRPGALAERLVVPSRFAWRVDGLEPAALVCVEPLTVVEAALRRLSRELPSAALVVGAGPQGIAHVPRADDAWHRGPRAGRERAAARTSPAVLAQ